MHGPTGQLHHGVPESGREVHPAPAEGRTGSKGTWQREEKPLAVLLRVQCFGLWQCWSAVSHLRTPWSTTMAWSHQDCSCPQQGWRQCPWHCPGPEPSLKEQERLQCLFLNPRPAPKGHQQQHSYSQAGQRGPSLLHGTRQAACKLWDLAKIGLGSYHEFTRCLHERNRCLSVGKHGLHGKLETLKLDGILGKISSRKEL